MYKLLFPFLILGMTTVHAAQTCNNNSTPSTPFGQFDINSSDETVTDDKTRLMWKRCLEGQSGDTCQGIASTFNWQAALQQAETVNTSGGFANYTDWRVPNIKELASIVEDTCSDPAVNLVVFPNISGSQALWSSSPTNDREDDFAYGYIDMVTGKVTSDKARTETLYLRLVRDL